jgi:hypothetical protein
VRRSTRGNDTSSRALLPEEHANLPPTRGICWHAGLTVPRRERTPVQTEALPEEPMSKVVVITGGSRGIGAGTSRLAAGRGYAVCVNHVRNGAAADQVLADCRRAGVNAIGVRADVAAEVDVVRLFETVNRELGRVTALVNNAGIRIDHLLLRLRLIPRLRAAGVDPDVRAVEKTSDHAPTGLTDSVRSSVRY